MSLNAIVTLLRCADSTLKNPLSPPRTWFVANDIPAPASAFHIGPSCRHVSVGMYVRLRRSVPFSVAIVSVPPPARLTVEVGLKVATLLIVKVSARCMMFDENDDHWYESVSRSLGANL